MRIASAAITVITASVLAACAATPVAQDEGEVDPCSFGCQVFKAMFEGLAAAAFDSLFSTDERPHHSPAAAPTPASYAPPPGHRHKQKHKHEHKPRTTEAPHKKDKKEARQ